MLPLGLQWLPWFLCSAALIKLPDSTGLPSLDTPRCQGIRSGHHSVTTLSSIGGEDEAQYLLSVFHMITEIKVLLKRQE